MAQKFENEVYVHICGNAVNRVARCFIFKPKIQIWVYFGGPWNGKG
jgi:hypothetical protein